MKKFVVIKTEDFRKALRNRRKSEILLEIETDDLIEKAPDDFEEMSFIQDHKVFNADALHEKIKAKIDASRKEHKERIEKNKKERVELYKGKKPILK